MQTPAAAAAAASAAAVERVPASYVVRLSGWLAALLGRAEGVEMNEDEVLDRLREAGQITYPSPLLAPLLERLPEVFGAEVLPRLDPADRAMCSRVGGACRAAVADSGLPRAGTSAEVPLKISNFVGSTKRLAWAKDNMCPWEEDTCALIAAGGNLEALTWAREHGCDWDKMTCAKAAAGGHLEVLMWAMEHGCDWDRMTCANAAAGRHLEILRWAREHGCPWEEATFEVEDDVDAFNCCSLAARGKAVQIDLRFAPC